MAPAFWISPLGEVIEVHTSHAEVVNNNRTLFNLSEEYVNSIIREKGVLFDGGEARKEIFGLLFERGWIRLRYVPSGRFVSWTIQFDSRVKGCLSLISIWAQRMIEWAPLNGRENIRALDSTGNFLWGGMLKGQWVSLKDVSEDVNLAAKTKQ